jgi:hypothetical protein
MSRVTRHRARVNAVYSQVSLASLPREIWCHLLTEVLDMMDVAVFDTALSDKHTLRPRYLSVVQAESTVFRGFAIKHSERMTDKARDAAVIRQCSYLAWIAKRKAKVRSLWIVDTDVRLFTRLEESTVINALRVCRPSLIDFKWRVVRSIDTIQTLSKCSMLKTVDVRFSFAGSLGSGDGMKSLARCAQLEDVSLDGGRGNVKQVSAAAINNCLIAWTNLTAANLCNSKADDSTLRVLTRPESKVVSLALGDRWDPVRVSDAGFKYLSNYGKLRRLSIVNIAGLSAVIAGNPLIEWLTFSHLSIALTRQDFVAINTLSRLTRLDIHKCHLPSTQDIQLLDHCQNLEVLDLRFRNFEHLDTAVIEYLTAKCPLLTVHVA